MNQQAGIEKYLELMNSTRCIIPKVQRRVIGETILSKGPGCNMLVFGVGGDSIIWNTINEAGYTLFIEHDDRWTRKTREQIPGVNVITYQYNTRCEPEWPIHEQPAINSADLLQHAMPGELGERKWDVILIDGPTGFNNKCPGRMLPIFWSSLISDSSCDIFIDDYSRPIEFTYTNRFLFHKYSRYHLFPQRLQLLWLKSDA